jgi:hypothetical protein
MDRDDSICQKNTSQVFSSFLSLSIYAPKNKLLLLLLMDAPERNEEFLTSFSLYPQKYRNKINLFVKPKRPQLYSFQWWIEWWSIQGRGRMIGGNKNGENGNDIFRFWNQLTIKNVKGNTQKQQELGRCVSIFPVEFPDKVKMVFQYFLMATYLDGWKPIRRVLHFTTINVSTCKKFIDP